MKKIITFLMLMLCCISIVVAKPINVELAKRVAANFLKSTEKEAIHLDVNDLTDITATTPFHEFYVFSVKDKGFILVSGDDRALPILGYSTNHDFVGENIPTHVRWWLDNYEKQLTELREGDISPNPEVTSQWQLLREGGMDVNSDGAATGPLIATTWNQSPYYNNLCPTGTPTGCVATATAQVMKYWNWPVRGMGSHSYTHHSYGTLSADFNTTYDWENMPNWLSATSSATQVEAVAKLIFHVGVALEMNYASGGSTAYTVSYGGIVSPSAEEILPTYFLYDSTIVGVAEANYTSSDWINLLKNEIDNHRPMLFRGSGSYGGHSFVCDGYNASNQFHFNWGWGGSYDGYFTIGSLNPGGYSFNSSCWAVIGIQPSDRHIVTVTTNPTAGGTVTGAGSYSDGSTCTLTATPAFGYEFSNWTCGNTVLSTNATYSFTVNEDKTILANFTISENNCSISFADLPYTNNFDSYTTSTTAKTGVEPTCWSLAHQDVAMTDAYKPMIYYSSEHAHSGNYSLILNKRGIYTMPRYEGNINTLQLQFYVKQTALKYQLQVGVMSDPTDASTFVPVETIDNRTYTASVEHTVSFYSYSGTGHYIAFRNTLAPGYSGEFSCNYIDNLTLSPLPTYTVSATSDPIGGGTVIGTGEYTFGSSCTLIAMPAAGYSFSHWAFNDTIEISGGTYTNVYYPTNAESPYSYTQQIYYSSQLDGARDITGISYYLREYGCTSRTIDIYLAETSQNSFSTVDDYIPLSELQLVYSGTFSGVGNSWVDINFDNVFHYTGEGNLVVAFDDNTGLIGTAGFATSSRTGENNCAMHFHKTTDIDPASPNGNPERATTVQNDIRFISDIGSGLPNTPIYTFNVTSNRNLKAVFTVNQQNYTVLATANPAEGGTVTGSGTYIRGSNCTVVATPAPGYTFSNWTIDDSLEIADELGANYYYPTCTGTRYSYTQEIYSSSQLNGPMDITSIAYHIQATRCSSRNINLYLAETDIDSFYSVSDYIPLSQLHLVYSGTFGGPAESWATIILDSVFHYSGMHNLVVAFDDNTGATGYGCFYASDIIGLRAIHYQNTIDVDPASPYGTRQLNTGVQNHIRFVSDSVVSTSPTYSFTVTCNKRLKANFTPVSTCGISSSDLPYTVNFDSYTTSTTAKTGIEPPCWTLAHQDVAITPEYRPMVYYAPANAHSGNYSLILNKRGIYAMPKYDGDVSTLQLKFYVKQSALKYQLQVGVLGSLNNADSFTPVTTIDNSTTNSEFVTVDFANYTGGGHYIAFRNILASGYTGDYSLNYIDDLSLELRPASSCGISASDLPYTDNFDSYTTSTTAKTMVEPPCWTLAHQDVEITDAYRPMVYYAPANAHSGNYSLILNKRGIYAMPEYDGDVSTLQLKFYVKQSALKYQLQVGVLGSLNNADSFTPVATIDNTTTNSEFVTVDFANYTGGGHYIAFRNILASGYTGNFSLNYIDDLTLELRPANSCGISASDLPYTDNFDSYTTSTTAKTGIEPPCWTLAHQDVAITDAYRPMVYYAPANAHSGNYSLILNKRGIYAMPEYDGDVSTLQLKFYVKQSALKYQLQVGVLGSLNNADSFTPVATIDNTTTNSEFVTVDFANYTGGGHYIAFRNILASGYTGNYSLNYIDDLTLELSPTSSCSLTADDLPYIDNFDSYTFSTIAKTGVEPPCWTLAHQDVAITDAYRPMVYYAPANAHSGNYSLILNKRGIYAMPEFDGDVSTLQLQFYVKQTALKYQLQVGVLGSLNSADSFTPVVTIDNASTTVSAPITVNFSAYSGTGRYIAFRNILAPGYTGDYSLNYIDDLALSQVGSASNMDEDGAKSGGVSNGMAAHRELSLYPNPTTGVVNVEADEEVLRVDVYDYTGRRVATFENQATIDLGRLATGIYTLRMTLPERIEVRRVVKQ